MFRRDFEHCTNSTSVFSKNVKKMQILINIQRAKFWKSKASMKELDSHIDNIFPCTAYNRYRRMDPPDSSVAKHVAINAEDLGFDSRTGQIKHHITDGSPSL